MASLKNRQFVIENGPGKFDLSASLFTGSARRRPNVVEFSLHGISKPLEIVITSIAQEDGSGESWNFKGITYQYSKLRFPAEGYFSSLKRTGTIQLVLPAESVSLASPIDELNFAPRTYYALKNLGVNTLGDITQCYPWQLLKGKDFGQKALVEVEDVLSGMLLSLRGAESV
jgi:hypothetical protein